MDEDALWKVLYTVAAAFPDALSEERLKGYFDFFNSLKYTLPTPELRREWIAVTSAGELELSWKTFSKVRGHKKLLLWLFHVHDEILKRQGKNVAKNRASRYALLTRGNNAPKQKNTNMTLSLALFKTKISKTKRAIDQFLTLRFPSFATMSTTRRAKLRQQYIDDAAKYYWKHFSDDIAITNAGFANRSLPERRDIIFAAFDDEFMPLHKRVVDKRKRIYEQFWNKFQ